MLDTKPHHKKLTRHTPLQRGTPPGRQGKGGRKNARALRVFKRDCREQGVDERCERRGPNCTGTENLTWAHGRKRVLLREGELEHFAIVCCVNCHGEMDEGMTHDEMADEVERIIALRPERRLEAA